MVGSHAVSKSRGAACTTACVACRKRGERLISQTGRVLGTTARGVLMRSTFLRLICMLRFASVRAHTHTPYKVLFVVSLHNGSNPSMSPPPSTAARSFCVTYTCIGPVASRPRVTCCAASHGGTRAAPLRQRLLWPSVSPSILIPDHSQSRADLCVWPACYRIHAHTPQLGSCPAPGLSRGAATNIHRHPVHLSLLPLSPTHCARPPPAHPEARPTQRPVGLGPRDQGSSGSISGGVPARARA